MVALKEFENHLATLKLSKKDRSARLLAVLSAVIAVCRPELTGSMLGFLAKCEIGKEAIYETVLQSYLFLGFPRMIEAALVFNEVYGDIKSDGKIERISASESKNWHESGLKLCRQVYGPNYEILKNRFTCVSPEIFR